MTTETKFIVGVMVTLLVIDAVAFGMVVAWAWPTLIVIFKRGSIT